MSSRTLTIARQDTLLQTPHMYAVIIHNDDMTTMDFVVDMLVQIFQKTPPQAAALMMDVHEAGSGIAGVYIFDIACTKKFQADRLASEKGFPLKLTIREVDA